MKQWNFYTTDEIKPAGWLKRQLEIQAEGLSGNLDKVWPDVRDSAWIGGPCEGWERVPYWLDGFIPLAYLLENEDMIARAKKYIDAILERQWEDGWICPCTAEKIPTYDTWAVLLITKVLVVYYECSKDERIPAALYKALKNYYDLLKNGTIHLFNWGEYRWYEGFIAIDFLYRRTKEDWLLALARILKEQGKDYREVIAHWEKPLNKWTYYTHIVNLCMMLKAEAVSHDLLGTDYTDEAEYFRTLLDQWNGTPVGLFTGDECLSGLSPIQGTELCAVVEQMYSYEHLFAVSGDQKWAERLELLAFNALPAAISDDMWAHQYVQMSNQISCERFGGKPIFRTNGKDAHLFGLEPHFGCCTSNFNQGWPKLALSAFMHNGDTIVNPLPLPAKLNADGIRIEIQTDYPFKNTVTYCIDTDKDFTLVVKGTEYPFKAGEKTAFSIEIERKPVLIDRPNGLKAVQYGSLIFSLPIQYEKKMLEYTKNGVERKFPYCDYEYIGKSDWNYAYCGAPEAVAEVAVDAVPFSSEHPALTVRIKGCKIDWGFEEGYENVCAKLPQSREPIGEPEALTLIPYGCAKLRMTELPLVGDGKIV
ncbi:MAG: glycoside hydrolase family 127 protein [Clostridia bacterium]|nr:glycoside hydrolase family 127 protein [Clostridia bacterium]